MNEVSVATKTKTNNMYPTAILPGQLKNEVSSADKKFLAIITHDIKTPIGSVIGFLHLIKAGLFEWDRDKIAENIEVVLSSAERTFSLLNNLLEWANAENIFKSYQPGILDFDKIIKEEIADIQVFTTRKQIKINSLVPRNQTVFADKNMVKSILRNLLTNAIKYSYEHGRIDLISKRDKGFLEITIKDYGVGINAKTTSTFFSSTNYISTLGTNNEPGTGYGLLLCKELIEINKGKIWIAGNAAGGSEFKFTLPLASY